MFQPRHHRIEERDCGLLAFLVIDDSSRGPAAVGIRTRRYAHERQAREEAAALARAMTYKCALAGLPAGGGTCVVVAHDDLDRERAFERLGDFIEGLASRFLTAGDLGTTAADLAAVARRTAYVDTDEAGLGHALGSGCVRAMEACLAESAPSRPIAGARVAAQGCGTVGGAVARAARQQGAEVLVADIDRPAAEALAGRIGARVVAAQRILETEADILAPCAVGGVLDDVVVPRLRAGAVCGAANNILASAGEVTRSQSIASVSNNAVNRDRSSAEGTSTWRTPCVGHSPRGTSASMIVLYWQVSRCRHRRRRWSYPAMGSPHSGHVSSEGRFNPTSTTTPCSSSNNFTSVTRHGSGKPKICSYNARSRIFGSLLPAQETETLPPYITPMPTLPARLPPTRNLEAPKRANNYGAIGRSDLLWWVG